MSPRFIASVRALHPPTQARSIATQERLLDAAERLFSEQGYEETSVAEIVQRAGASVGVFYNRFVDKSEIFRAVQRRMVERLLAIWSDVLERAAPRGAKLPEIVCGVVTGLAGFLRDTAPLLRAFNARSLADQQANAINRSVIALLVTPLSDLLLQHRDEIAHSRPELAIEVGFQMVYATLRHAVQYGDLRPIEQPGGWAELVEELARSYVAYLRSPG